MTLAVAMITFQSERTLRKTLECIKPVADEIIIVDSGSTDATLKIAEEFQADIHHSPFETYGLQKQKAIKYANSTWVLLLDDDEYVDEKLVESLSNLKLNDSEHAAFRLPLSLIFLGKKFRFGKEARSMKLRLFRNGMAVMNDAQVHEKLEVRGSIGTLKGLIWHDYHESYEQSLQKMDKYAKLWAQEHRKKVSKWDIWLRRLFSFPKIYIVDFNFLNGKAGYLWSKSLALYQYKKYQYLYDLNQE